MKKIILFFGVATLGCGSVFSQAQESSLPAGFTNGETTWIVKAGVSLNSVTGDDVDDMKTNWANLKLNGEFKNTIGGVVTVGMNTPLGMGPFYFGSYLTMGMRGYKISEKWKDDSGNKAENLSSLTAVNAQIVPMSIGGIVKLSDRVALDLSVGLFFSYDFAGTFTNEVDYPKKSKTSIDLDDVEDYSKYDTGLIGGIGLWINRWEVELNYQRGIASIYDGGSTYSRKFLLTLGYAF